MAIGSLTLDTGVGVDDLLAICMSRGDVLIYAGTDPSTANSWQISGKYKLGTVIGDRPFVKLGGDLIAITSGRLHTLASISRCGSRAAAVGHL